MKYLLLLIAEVLFANPCLAQTTSNDTAQFVTLDTLTISAPAGPQVYRSFAPKQWEIQHTRVALSFNWIEKTADAREWITLHPYFYATDTLIMDAKGMRIDTISLVGKKGNTPLRFVYDHDQVKIMFTCMYNRTDTVNLYLRYTAMPYSSGGGGSAAITEDRGLYFINTDYTIPHKPAQIWTQGETESNSHWLITIDKPNTRFTTQVELTVPDSFTTLSNGAMIKQLKGKGGMRTDIWKMNMPIQAYAVMFSIGRYAIIKDHWRNKEVNYYVEQPYAPYAAKMFNNTPEMMEYFSLRTGVPFPWNKYSQVVVRDYISGAMENTSASLFGEFMNQNAREIADKNSEDVVSHELFHQWFGDYVTAESWSNLTVNESFANYGEQLWRYHKYGKASGDELAWNDLSGYISISAFSDPQLQRYTYDSREEVFDAVSYNKGGAILRYLNNLIGDAAFDRAMNIYLTQNALHSAEAHNWRMAVEAATGQDWNVFFNQWYFHAGHPVLKVNYLYNDSLQVLKVSVTQAQEDSIFLYHLPMKTAIIYGADKTVIDWNITKRKEWFTFPYKNGVRPVIIPDYTHIVPGEFREDKKPEQWLAQFIACDDYVNKRLAVTAAGKLPSDSIARVIITAALSDNLSSIKRLAMSQIKNSKTESYQRNWTPKILALATTDSSKLVRADAVGVLGAWKVVSAKPLMLSYLSDSSYMLAGNALDALNKVDKDTAYLLAKQLLKTYPKATLEYVIWNVIGGKGAPEDIALFEEHAPYVLGAKKFTFALALESYLKNVTSDASFSRGVDVLAMMIKHESMKAYRSTLGGYLFQAASEEKGRSKSDKKEEAATAAHRLDLVKVVTQKIVNEETDPETQKEYKQKLKDTFE